MKKLLTTLTLVVMAVIASAQDVALRPINWEPRPQRGVRQQSFATNVDNRSVSVLWLQDGLSTNYTAVSVPMFQVTGLGNRVEIVGLGAFDSNFTKTNVWAGTGVAVNLLNHEGWNVKVYGGYKGFNVGDNFRRADGREAWVWGLGVSLPIR